MTREKTARSRFLLIGAGCGLGGALAYLGLLRLLVLNQFTDLRTLAGLALAAPGGLGNALVRDVGAVTWFGLPTEVIYLLAPAVLLSAGLVAARLTYAARAAVGLRAGGLLVLGFAPPMLLLGVRLGRHTGSPDVLLSLLVVPVLYPLVFGAVGGVVGVKT